MYCSNCGDNNRYNMINCPNCAHSTLPAEYTPHSDPNNHFKKLNRLALIVNLLMVLPGLIIVNNYRPSMVVFLLILGLTTIIVLITNYVVRFAIRDSNGSMLKALLLIEFSILGLLLSITLIIITFQPFYYLNSENVLRYVYSDIFFYYFTGYLPSLLLLAFSIYFYRNMAISTSFSKLIKLNVLIVIINIIISLFLRYLRDYSDIYIKVYMFSLSAVIPRLLELIFVARIYYIQKLTLTKKEDIPTERIKVKKPIICQYALNISLPLSVIKRIITDYAQTNYPACSYFENNIFTFELNRETLTVICHEVDTNTTYVSISSQSSGIGEILDNGRNRANIKKFCMALSYGLNTIHRLYPEYQTSPLCPDIIKLRRCDMSFSSPVFYNVMAAAQPALFYLFFGYFVRIFSNTFQQIFIGIISALFY